MARTTTSEERPDVTVITEATTEEGHPFLMFPTAGKPKHPVCMGVRKIKAVLTNLEAARAFVAKHDKPAAPKADLGAMVAKMSAEERAALAAQLLGAK